MEENADRVGLLKKIGLDVEAGTGPERMDLSHGPVPFEFIFGLGRGGLTPFELELAERKVGEDVVIFIQTQDDPAFFQHLVLPPLTDTGEVEAMYLKVRIRTVGRSEPREVVAALAEIANCGDHCCCQ